MSTSSYNLDRFVHAQDPVYATVLEELRTGRKRSHWMWFVFPQLAGLGYSSLAQLYGISGLAEAAHYLAHPILGPRLQECVSAVITHKDLSIRSIFGSPDDLKFRSCMTLFDLAATECSVFREALEVFYRGEPDSRTLSLLAPAKT